MFVYYLLPFTQVDNSSRKSRVHKTGSGGSEHVKSHGSSMKRAPSMPSIQGDRKNNTYEGDKRSKSLIENTSRGDFESHQRRVIPDIVKHSPSAHPFNVVDIEDPHDDIDDERLEALLSPHPDDGSDSERSEAYETISRSESMTDLRIEKDKSKKSPKKSKYDSKKSSLISLSLDSFNHTTMFDKDNDEDNDAPGAFKNPEAALKTALEDLQSDNWQIEVSGLSAIIRVSVWNSNLIVSQLAHIMDLVNHELKNPRSQVCKVAAQTFTKLFSLFGAEIEKENNFDEIVKALLLKTGDTNKFLRIDASDALDTMVENVSVHKAISSLVSGGLSSKNVMIKVRLGEGI